MRSIRWTYAQTAARKLALLTSLVFILSACQTEAPSQARIEPADLPPIASPSPTLVPSQAPSTPIPTSTTRLDPSPTRKPYPTFTPHPIPELEGRILFTRKLEDRAFSDADLFEWSQGQVQQLPLRGLIYAVSPNARFFVTHQEFEENEKRSHRYSIYDREKDFRDPFSFSVDSILGGSVLINDDGKTIAFRFACGLEYPSKLIVGEIAELDGQIARLGKSACANQNIPYEWASTWIAGTNKLILQRTIEPGDPLAAKLGIEEHDLPTQAAFTQTTAGELSLIGIGSWYTFYSIPNRPVIALLNGQDDKEPRSVWLYDHENNTLEATGTTEFGFIFSPDQRYTLSRGSWYTGKPCIRLYDCFQPDQKPFCLTDGDDPFAWLPE